MTSENLYEVLGDISERHINGARAEHRAKKPGWAKWGGYSGLFVPDGTIHRICG